LIKKIRENYKFTRIQIINKIDEDIFLKEKDEFLEIFKDIIAITLEDILRGKSFNEKY
jgi:anaerobic ribonucleoside-triphosphate reductase